MLQGSRCRQKAKVVAMEAPARPYALIHASTMFSMFATGQETQAHEDAAEASFFCKACCCSANRRNLAATWSMACQVVEVQPPSHADEAAEAFEEECPTDDDALPEAFRISEKLHCIAQSLTSPKNAGGESPGLELSCMSTIALSTRHAWSTQFDMQFELRVLLCRNVVLVCRKKHDTLERLFAFLHFLAEGLADAPESVPGVHLVCDERVSLFSTDFRPMDVTEARSSQNIGHA